MTARTIASPMPVLPEVGSTMVPPGWSLPCFSSASIIDSPMRSLTEDSGLKNSHLARISAFTPASAASLPSRTTGVAPMVATMPS